MSQSLGHEGADFEPPYSSYVTGNLPLTVNSVLEGLFTCYKDVRQFQ
jgi:hypothetical protein